MTTTKKDLHRLIDELPDSELIAAHRYLQFLRRLAGDPLLRTLLDAPWDDEAESREEVAAVEEARDDVGAGRLLAHDELKRRLSKPR